MLAAVTRQMVSLCAEFLMVVLQFLALLGNGVSLLSNLVLVSVWPKSLLPDEFMVQCCDLVHLLVHTVQVLLSSVDIQEDLGVFWLCDSWKDSHELTIILGYDILLKVLSFSINTLKDLDWLLLLPIILGRCLLLVEVLRIIVEVLEIEYVIGVVQEVLCSARLLGSAWIVGSQLIGVVIKRCVVQTLRLRLCSVHFVQSVIMVLEQALLEDHVNLHVFELVL